MKLENKIFKAYSGFDIWECIKKSMTYRVEELGSQEPHVTNRCTEHVEDSNTGEEACIHLSELSIISEYETHLENLNEVIDESLNDAFYYMELLCNPIDLMNSLIIDNSIQSVEFKKYIEVALMVFKFTKSEIKKDYDYDNLINIAEKDKDLFKMLITI